MAVAPPDGDPFVAPPTTPPSVPPVVRAPWAGRGAALGALGAPTITQPNWEELLNQYLAPYQSIYDAQMAALQNRIGAQSQLAKQRFSGSDTSTMARLADEHTDLGRRIVNTLAAQGLFNSGATPFQQKREDLRYKRASTDASNALLDYLTGLQNQLADAQFQGQLGLANQRMSIGSMLPTLYQPTVSAPRISTLISGTTPSAAPRVPGSALGSIFQKAYG